MKHISSNISVAVSFFCLIIYIFCLVFFISPSKHQKNKSEKTEEFEIVSITSVPNISEKSLYFRDKLYEIPDGVIYYPNRAENNYEILVILVHKEIYGVRDLIIVGEGEDFNRFVREINFLYERRARRAKSGAKNTWRGFSQAGDDLVDGVLEILKNPGDSLISLYDAIKGLSPKALDVIQGKYSLEDMKNFCEAFIYNHACEWAKNNGLDCQRTFLNVTKKEIYEASYEDLAGRASFEALCVFVPATKIGKLKTLSKFSKYDGFGRFFKYSRSGDIKRPLGKTENESIKNFKNKIYSKKPPKYKNKRTRTKKAEKNFYNKINVGDVEIFYVGKHKIRTRKKNNIDPNRKNKKDGMTNCERMKIGKPPYDEDGSIMHLHHHKQEEIWTDGGSPSGYLVEMSQNEHKSNSSFLHDRSPVSKDERKTHPRLTREYWKARAKEICQ